MHFLEKRPTHNKIMESIQGKVINGKSYADAVKRAVSENRYLFDVVLDYFDEDNEDDEKADTSERNNSDEDNDKLEKRKISEESP